MSHRRFDLPLAAILLCVSACGPSSAPSPAESDPAGPSATASEPLATRALLLERLAAAGVDSEVKPVPHVPRRLAAALAELPGEPQESFMFGVNGEGMVAMRFVSSANAAFVASRYEEGFRFRNWFVLGQVSVESWNAVRDALGE